MDLSIRSAFLLLASVLGAGVHLQAQVLEPHWWMADDNVEAILADTANDRIYLGGEFNYVGPMAPYGGMLSLSTGSGNSAWPAPNGLVQAVIPDGSGGWYIGGGFTRMGDQDRHGLAHIASNGTLSPEFETTGFVSSGSVELVRALERKGDTLFVGGDFDGVGDSRLGVARVDTLSGSTLGVFPSVDGAVYAITEDGVGGWVIGGEFTAVNGEPRQNLARVNADGSLHPWAPTCQCEVRDFLRAGATLYVGGSFSWVANVARTDLAAFDLGSGALTDWAPQTNGSVNTLGLHAGAVLIGGTFATVNGASRTNIAAVDALTGALTSWAPDANDEVERIRIHGGQIYVAGRFSTIGGAPGTGLALLDPITSLAMPWAPNITGTVTDMDITGNTAYFSGSFTTVGGLPRQGMAAVDLTTGAPTTWAPVHNASSSPSIKVRATPGRIYVVRGFTTIGGVPRNGIAALDPVTGATLPWTIDPGGGAVYAIVPVAGEVLIGGDFTVVHRVARRHLAAIRLSTSEWIGAMPASTSFAGVYSFAQAQGKLFVGGDFSNLGGQTRIRLASIDLNTLAVTTWNPNVSDDVRDLHVDGSTLYLTGLFTQVNSLARTRLAAFDITTNTLLPWNPTANGAVHSIDVEGTTAYVGGAFTSAGGQTRNRLAAVNTITGLATNWAPTAGTSSHLVYSVKVKGNDLLVGGSFTSLAGSTRRYIGAVDRTSATLSPIQGSCNGTVYVIAVQGDTLYAGGVFTSIGGAQRSRIACLDANTGQATSFNCTVGGGTTLNGVKSFALRSDTLYFGGGFTNVNGVTRNRIAAVNASTGSLLAWNPGASAAVGALLSHGDTLFVGGAFTTIGGQAVARLAALNSVTGSVHTGWAPSPSSSVDDLLWHDGTLFVGGLFATIGGASRRGVAQLLPGTGLATAWNVGTDVLQGRALAIANGALYVGGYIPFLQGQSGRNIAAFDLQTAAVLPFNVRTNDTQDAFPDVTGVAVHDTIVHFGGWFDMVSGATLFRKHLAAAHRSTGAIGDWDPRANFDVYVMSISEGRLFVGGKFTQIGERIREGLAVFTLCTEQTYYADLDEDGFGDPSSSITACAVPAGHVLNADDCNDSDPDIFTGAPCDDLDSHTTLDAYEEGCVCVGTSVLLDARIFLQGPYVGGIMRDSLRTGGWLPLSEPYTGLGFVHSASGGGETIAPSVLGTTGPDAIVDWVVVSLRNAGAPAIDLGSRSALVQRDGDVVDLDGASPVRFPLPPGAYLVVVRHRNHLGIMSASPVVLSAQPTVIDFRNGDVPTYGVEAQRTVGNDRLLWAGDVKRDGILKYTGFQNDRDAILQAIGGATPNNTIPGYLSSDVNLDGVAKYTGLNNDRDPILVNIGGTVPNVTRTAQLP